MDENRLTDRGASGGAPAGDTQSQKRAEPGEAEGSVENLYTSATDAVRDVAERTPGLSTGRAVRSGGAAPLSASGTLLSRQRSYGGAAGTREPLVGAPPSRNHWLRIRSARSWARLGRPLTTTCPGGGVRLVTPDSSPMSLDRDLGHTENPCSPFRNHKTKRAHQTQARDDPLERTGEW
jgi:hypothetical protein